MSKKSLKGKYLIIDIDKKDYMKDKDGNYCIYDTFDEACLTCGVYEFDGALVVEVKHQHRERIAHRKEGG